MHTAMIRRISTDASGRWLVTASDDKTARVWEIASGRLLATLRPPQDEGNEGKLYAVAVSPDGNTVAIGGWTGYGWERSNSIYLFDPSNGQLLRRIAGLPGAIRHLVFTRDGRWLAASLGGANGVRVFCVVDGHEAGRDAEYGSSSYSADFNRDGSRLVTTSDDGKIRLYAVNTDGLRKLTEGKAPGGDDPYLARFSPDGRYIAVGFVDTSAVSVLDAATLAPAYAPDVGGVDDGNLESVVWSNDGKYLYAAGSWQVHRDYPVRRWSHGGRGGYEDIPVSRNSVMDFAPLPDGSLLFGASDPLWGVISARGTVVRRQEAAIADFRDSGEGFRLSADGRQVRFAYKPGGEEPAVFDVGAAKLGPDQEGLTAPRIGGRGLTIENWKNSTSPTLNGKALQLNNYEKSRSVAVSTDNAYFALGAEWSLRLFDRDGRQQWERPVPGAVWAVNISGDNHWVVAAYGDGTIRWHRIADGQEVLAFFPHADRRQWIAWTREGFFDASKEAEALIGYHLNRGRDHEGEFITAKQVLDRYYRPALIARRLEPDGDRLIAAAVKDLGDVREVLAGAGGKTPLLELVSPPTAQTDSEYVLTVRVKDQGGGVGRLIYRIDGVEVQGRPAGIPVGDTVSRSFPLPPGPHLVSAAAVNGRGVESAPVEAAVTVKARAERPALHVLAVGVTKYRDHALAEGVHFAAADAETVANRFETQGAVMYRAVDVRALPDDQATRDNIEKEMRGFAARVDPDDVFVLYMAGHGAAFDRAYHFVPWEARYTSQDALRDQSMDEQLLRTLLAGISARKTLVLLDTCSAGAFGADKGRALGDKDVIDRFSRLSGRAVIAAAADDKMALEGESGHGAFTFALLEGLTGKADTNKSGTIEVSELADYVEQRLPEITLRNWGYEQFPVRETSGQSFAILSSPIQQ